MHHRHLELGAVMMESDGWLRPSRYTSVEHELERLQTAVGLCDIIPTGKLSLHGSDLDFVLSSAFGDGGSLDVGAVRPRRLGNGPAIVARLASDEFMILIEPGQTSLMLNTMGGRDDRCAHVVDTTSALAGVSITGPSGHLLLSTPTELDVGTEAFPNMTCAQSRVAEIHGVLLRLDSGDLLSYELYFGPSSGSTFGTPCFRPGEEYHVTPFGIETLVHLETQK